MKFSNLLTMLKSPIGKQSIHINTRAINFTLIAHILIVILFVLFVGFTGFYVYLTLFSPDQNSQTQTASNVVARKETTDLASRKKVIDLISQMNADQALAEIRKTPLTDPFN